MWNNLGLCSYYSGQYDLTFKCFDRALTLAEDNQADVWYNIGHVLIGMGDLNLAIYAFKVALAHDSLHAESYCNLGVLELRRGNTQEARNYFESAIKQNEFLYEPFYNTALLAYKLGDFQESY
mmetsp:Transcript_4875/g.2721  ORF Transcript_4875/g.2721 Transcript_4875/m.2721 type:complete len:123 (-) Transcript_4875:116-484(-)|eukprot:CAMPEP_0201281668 /NCGR_PEP_ID=MMETSP1317-20130820/3684_1 /ASSEMBLY_ACC=CAM_ASM_000770 /TAXON_ID=187299 /ORGANISM="Undescribed Undescribed, Strain Undescribed" /LENGTH=122 /DNA_ID=CAMNT_0047592173 /DNA_START=149 /DNA_END=517 /DNA_ORIENTATION=+